jgi:hypothetical protein
VKTSYNGIVGRLGTYFEEVVHKTEEDIRRLAPDDRENFAKAVRLGAPWNHSQWQWWDKNSGGVLKTVYVAAKLAEDIFADEVRRRTIIARPPLSMPPLTVKDAIPKEPLINAETPQQGAAKTNNDKDAMDIDEKGAEEENEEGDDSEDFDSDEMVLEEGMIEILPEAADDGEYEDELKEEISEEGIEAHNDGGEIDDEK